MADSDAVELALKSRSMLPKRHILNRLFFINAAVLIGLLGICVVSAGGLSDGGRIVLWIGMSVLGLSILLLATRNVVSGLDSQLYFARKSVDLLAGGEEQEPVPATISLPVRTFTDNLDRWKSLLGEHDQHLIDRADRIRSVLDSMVEGVITLDEDWRIVFANIAAKSQLSMTVDSVMGRQLLEVVRIPEIEKAVAEVYRTRDPCKSEFETIRGPRRILSLRCSVLSRIGDGISPGDETVEATDENNSSDHNRLDHNRLDYNERGVVLVLRDMTELRALENMRRDFVTNVSHELKTPLASISAYAETLRLGAIDDQENRIGFLERIEEQALRLNDLILDLIQLARIESGQETYELASVDVAEITERRVHSFVEDAGLKQIDLSLKLARRPLALLADEEAIRTIVDNLITNAIRYTPQNGKVIVECEQSGDEIIVSVSDSGLGIAPEHQERIFERFYRVDKARSSDLGGTGLGLSIVKHLAQSMNGTVSIESKIGRGSTFRVRLPVRKSANTGQTMLFR